MTTTITLPPQATFSNLHLVTGMLLDPHGYPSARAFRFDFANLSFIDGSGLTALSNTLRWLSHHNVSIEFANFEDLRRFPISYLDDCGFFETNVGYRLRRSARIRSTTLPFTEVGPSRTHSWIENKLTPWLSSILDVHPNALSSVKACVKEVFNNVRDHSTLQMGFAHAQHYPNKREVCVTISDFGKGIPANIQAAFPDLDDAQAILKATEDGFTTQSTPRNRGIGLDFLVSYMLGNGGRVSIYSSRGSLACYPSYDGRPVRRPKLGNGRYPGTLVDIAIQTDRFAGDDEAEEELNW